MGPGRDPTEPSSRFLSPNLPLLITSQSWAVGLGQEQAGDRPALFPHREKQDGDLGLFLNDVSGKKKPGPALREPPGSGLGGNNSLT